MTDSGRTHLADDTAPIAARRALHAIAVFEAVKGLAALAGNICVVSFMMTRLWRRQRHGNSRHGSGVGDNQY